MSATTISVAASFQRSPRNNAAHFDPCCSAVPCERGGGGRGVRAVSPTIFSFDRIPIRYFPSSFFHFLISFFPSLPLSLLSTRENNSFRERGNLSIAAATSACKQPAGATSTLYYTSGLARGIRIGGYSILTDPQPSPPSPTVVSLRPSGRGVPTRAPDGFFFGARGACNWR